MPGVKPGEENSVNGKVAKRLRRIARGLKLNPESKLQPVGIERTYEKDGKTYAIRRPLALGPCFRRAYQEAKKLYLGQVRAQTGHEDLDELRVAERQFRHRVIDSTKAQPPSP